jgi:hypothetical protein
MQAKPPRLLPPSCDVESEVNVIGNVLDNRVPFEQLQSLLKASDFYEPKHQAIWEAMGALSRNGKPVDLESVRAQLSDTGQLRRAGGSAYLLELKETSPVILRFELSAERIASASRDRQFTQLLRDAAANPTNAASERHELLGRLTALHDAGTPKGKQVLGAFDIFAPLPPIQWAVQGLDICPGAPTLIAGYGFSGKSMALQALAIQLAAGLPIWGCFAAQRGSVIHFDWEQGEHLTRLRYQRIAYAYDLGPDELDGRIGLVCYPDFYVDDSDAYERLVKLCTGRTVAIFDSFRAMCRNTDENSSEARVPLDMLARVSQVTGCAMLVIHHARKPNESDVGGARTAIRGSGSLYDSCAAVFVLEGKPEDPERTIWHVKARVSGKLQDPMILRIEEWGEPASDGSVPGIRVTVGKAPTVDERERTALKRRHARLAEEVRGLFAMAPERRGGIDSLARELGRKATDIRGTVAYLIEQGELIVTGATTDRGYRYLGPVERPPIPAAPTGATPVEAAPVAPPAPAPEPIPEPPAQASLPLSDHSEAGRERDASASQLASRPSTSVPSLGTRVGGVRFHQTSVPNGVSASRPLSNSTPVPPPKGGEGGTRVELTSRTRRDASGREMTTLEFSEESDHPQWPLLGQEDDEVDNEF